ncbi:MAG: hypothetical protein ABFD24_06140 [Anaerolineaceae bacterium]
MTERMTLADYAVSPKPFLAGVARKLREESTFMDTLNFVTANALAIKVVREGSLPTIAWRNIGNPHGSSKAGQPDEVVERAYSIGNEILFDKTMLMDKTPRIYDPKTYQADQITKAIARTFNDACINGLPSDLLNPVGLWYRLMNDFPSQMIAANLDISSDATGLAANIQSFFDALDSLLYSLTGKLDGNGVYLYCNDTMLLRYQSIMRQSNQLSTTTDALGRTFTDYKGAKFVDMGYKTDDLTPIINNLENGTALTGGAQTSIYAARVGDEYFTGWQEYAMEVFEPELTSDKVTYKQVIDWVPGIAVSHPRSIARLHSITAK